MLPKIGPIPTYSIFYSLGIMSYFIVAGLTAKRLRLDRHVWITGGICYMLSIVIGAKALYDIREGDFQFQALFNIQHYLQGGLWGGLLVYFPIALLLMLIISRDKPGALDLVALSVPVPWIIAKIGCLLNGCCYGSPSSMPWAIKLGQASGAPAVVYVHPTQVYEIILMIFIIICFRLLRSARRKGTMLLWFMVLYGIGRAVTEIWRGDLQQQIHIGPLTISQLILLVTAGVSAIILIILRSINIEDSEIYDWQEDRRSNLIIFLERKQKRNNGV